MSEHSLQLVTFRLGNEEFGIDIKKVQEINRMIEVTNIPNSPDYIEGIVNLRGKIIPVVSLRRKLGFEQTEYNKATRIMVVEVEGKVLGADRFGLYQRGHQPDRPHPHPPRPHRPLRGGSGRKARGIRAPRRGYIEGDNHAARLRLTAARRAA